MAGGLAIPVGLSAVTATSSGSTVPKAFAVICPSPTGRTVVSHFPLRPRVWITHQRTGTLSPATTLKVADPPSLVTVTTGGAGVAAPSHGNAGTSAVPPYTGASVAARRS